MKKKKNKVLLKWKMHEMTAMTKIKLLKKNDLNNFWFSKSSVK